MNRKQLLLLPCSLAGLAGFAGSALAAADTLEEVIVTAERRAQSVLEVPLSITAFGDQQREEVGIITIQDMANFAPGVSFTMSNDRPSIRGIGRQSNFFTLDSPVANYFDGVYTSSVQDAQRRPIFIERTEIVRGPQGALSGRGSIAGAFMTTSKRPKETFGAEFGAFGGSFDRYGLEGTVTGPLTDWLRARLNLAGYRQDEGYFKNIASGRTEGDQPNNRQLAELLFDGDIGEDIDFFLKASFADYDESRHTGYSSEPFYAGVQNNPTAYGPSTGTLTPLAGFGFFDAIGGRLGTNTNNPVITTGDTRKFSNDFRSRQKLDDQHNYTAHLTWRAPFADVKWIGGHQNYLYTQFTDNDGTDVQQMRLPTGRIVAPGSINKYLEEREWYSNELTLTSNSEGPLGWIVGVYQSNEQFNQEPATTIFPGYNELNNPIGTVDTLLRAIGSPFNPAGIRTVVANPRPNTSVVGLLTGETISSAAFGQLDYNFNDQWKVTAGLRYNKDEKEASESLRYIANGLGDGLGNLLAGGSLPLGPISVDVTPVPVPGAALPRGVVRDRGIDPVTGYRGRDFKQDWTAVTGSVGVDFKPADHQLVFARIARGYRPGGFNAGFLYDPPQVDEETVDSYEVGYKATLFNRLLVSGTVFYYDYQDIQLPLPTLGRCTNPNDLSTCIILNSFVNMPKGESKGVEIELNYAATDHFGIYLTYGYLDASIKDGLVNGNGFSNPLDPAAVLPNANRYQAIPGQFDTGFTFLQRYTQDLSGNSLANSPRNRVAVNANYTFEFSTGNLALSSNYIWRDEQFADVFETGPAIVPSYHTVGLRAIWTDASNRYTVILYGNNLTDEDAPDGPSVASPGSEGGILARQRTGLATAAAPGPNGIAYYRTLNLSPPREYGLELQYRFGSSK